MRRVRARLATAALLAFFAAMQAAAQDVESEAAVEEAAQAAAAQPADAAPAVAGDAVGQPADVAPPADADAIGQPADVAPPADADAIGQPADVAPPVDADAIGQPADAAPIAPAEDAAPSVEDTRDSTARSKVKALGEGSEQLYVVEHPGAWSMHAENVTAAAIFALWHGVGGPSVASKLVLDFPFTMSVHQMTGERVVARVLEDYNYTLHYEHGRLAEVHVVDAVPSRSYKTPRLVESRTQWTNAEMTLLTADESATPPRR